MIAAMNDVPVNMVAFRASGEVTKDDYKIVFDKVERLIERQNELNYLMVIDTKPSNFSIGAWLKDALLGIENVTKWHRCAIVSYQDNIVEFTNIFGKIMPGEFRGFPIEELQHAIDWTSQKTI